MTSIRRRLLVPLAVLCLAEALLIGLGTWQVRRLHWKEGILARIEASERGPVLPLADDPPQWERVTATGRFRYDQAAWYGIDGRDTPKGPVLGHYQIVPLERPDGLPLLVNRGWVPEGSAPDQPAGTLAVTGFVRPATPAGWFSPADDVAGRRFYTLDPPAMARALGLGPVLPFSLTALGPDAPGAYPAPARSLPAPPNNHLSYAVTWFSLALALAVVFALRVRAYR